jgi:hypothetical protein
MATWELGTKQNNITYPYWYNNDMSGFYSGSLDNNNSFAYCEADNAEGTSDQAFRFSVPPGMHLRIFKPHNMPFFLGSTHALRSDLSPHNHGSLGCYTVEDSLDDWVDDEGEPLSDADLYEVVLGEHIEIFDFTNDALTVQNMFYIIGGGGTVDSDHDVSETSFYADWNKYSFAWNITVLENSCEATAARNWDTLKPEGVKKGQEGNGDCPPYLAHETECSVAVPKDILFCHPLLVLCDDGVLVIEGCVGASTCRPTILLLLSTLQSACLLISNWLIAMFSRGAPPSFLWINVGTRNQQLGGPENRICDPPPSPSLFLLRLIHVRTSPPDHHRPPRCSICLRNYNLISSMLHIWPSSQALKGP